MINSKLIDLNSTDNIEVQINVNNDIRSHFRRTLLYGKQWQLIVIKMD